MWLLFPCNHWARRFLAISSESKLENSERFCTEELARIEGEMLEARRSLLIWIWDLRAFREEVGKYIQRLQALAQTLATVEVYRAVVAKSQHLVRPSLAQS